MAEGDLKRGTVKWFNDHKSFKYYPDDGSDDLFVHQSAIKSDNFHILGEGKAVECVVEYENDGRAKVANVTGPDGASMQGNTHGGGGSHGGRSGGDSGYNGGGSGYGSRSRGGDHLISLSNRFLITHQ